MCLPVCNRAKSWKILYHALGKVILREFPISYRKGSRSEYLHIDHRGNSLISTQTGEVLGEVIDFRHWGGWLRRGLSFHESATPCSSSERRFRELVTQVFAQEKWGQIYFPHHYARFAGRPRPRNSIRLASMAST